VTALGQIVPHVYVGSDPKLLERVPNPMKPFAATFGVMTALVNISGDEFTTVCPITGGPDFGSIEINYSPDEWIVESKSLKLYLGSYRQEPTFHEKVVAKVCYDLRVLLIPKWIEVKGNFKPRGGLAIKPSAMWTPITYLEDDDGE